MSDVGREAERPERLVDTTGDATEIERLLARVRDHGVVVLAGPPIADDAMIDLYTDLHVRGITLIAGGTEDESRA